MGSMEMCRSEGAEGITMYERVPSELKKLNRWHVWRYSGERKIPLQVDGNAAKSNDPSTWTDFETAADAAQFFTGLAFELGEGYVGVDLDNCFDDSGDLRPWSIPVLARFDGLAYMEVSPSGRGIKLITKAKKPADSKCLHTFGGDKQQIECYESGRYWTITGDIYASNDEIGDGQKAVDWLCIEYMGKESGESTKKKREKRIEPAAPRTAETSLMTRARDYVASVPGEVKGNLRNAAFKLSGHLHSMIDEHSQRLTDAEVLELLRDWNGRNQPPLRDDELTEATVNGRKNGTPRADKPPEIIPDVVLKDTELDQVDISGILKQIEKKNHGTDSLPMDCLTAPGLIGDVVRYTLATAHYPLPELAMAGAIALMSTITGGKVTDKFRTRTNMYVLGLAPPGGGKDWPRKINRRILRAAGSPESIGPERIGSHSGVISTLAENWRTLFQIDEIGKMLMTMKDASKSPHLYNIGSVFLQVYSSSDDIWTADAYGDRKKVKTLSYPHCVIFGTSVPDGFWESLNAENLRDGLVARFMVFESPQYVDYQEPADMEIPPSIISRAAKWLSMKTHSGNLSGCSMEGGASPLKVDYDEQAKDRLHDHTVSISEKRKSEDSVTAAIWSRAAEKARKLALLFACSRCDCEYWPVITLEDADRAIRLNNWLTRQMLRQASRYVAENQHERDQLRVLRIIEESGQISQSKLTARTRWLSPRQRIDILGSLQESERISIVDVETAGRKARVFKAI